MKKILGVVIIMIGLLTACQQQELPNFLDNPDFPIPEVEYNQYFKENKDIRHSLYVQKDCRQGEPIHIYSTIEYIGEEDWVTIQHPSRILVHTLENEAGQLLNKGIVHTILVTSRLKRQQIYYIPYIKNSAFNPESSDEEDLMVKAYLEEEDLLLEAGRYLLISNPVFEVDEQSMDLAIDVELVVGVGEVSAQDGQTQSGNSQDDRAQGDGTQDDPDQSGDTQEGSSQDDQAQGSETSEESSDEETNKTLSYDNKVKFQNISEFYFDQETSEILQVRDQEFVVLTTVPVAVPVNENTQFVKRGDVLLILSDGQCDKYSLEGNRWINLHQNEHSRLNIQNGEIYYQLVGLTESRNSNYLKYNKETETFDFVLDYKEIYGFQPKQVGGVAYVSYDQPDLPDKTLANGNVQVIAEDYVTLTLNDKEVQVIDSRQYNEQTFYITKNGCLVNDNLQKVMFDRVILYDWHNKYLAYIGSASRDLTVYDFDKNQQHVIEGQFIEVAVGDEYVVGVTMDYQVKVYTLTEEGLLQEPIYTGQYTQLDADFSKSVGISGAYLLVRENSQIEVIDLQAQVVVDRFEARYFDISDKGRIFYSFMGNIIEYTPALKTQRLVSYGSAAVYIHCYEDLIITYESFDGPGHIVARDLDTDYLDEHAVDRESVGYFVFYHGNAYGTSLYVYDEALARFDLVSSHHWTIDYEVTDKGLEYDLNWRKTDENGAFYYETESFVYELRSNSTVVDKNQYTEALQAMLWQNIEQGHIGKEEVFLLDGWNMVVYPSPNYDNGTWATRGLGLDMMGYSPKGNTYYNFEFNVSRETKFLECALNEEGNQFYLIYEDTEQRFVSVFSIDGLSGFFTTQSTETIENLESKVIWNESGNGIDIE